MENIEKCTKNDRPVLQRVCISILHGIAMDKCSKNADTYPREFGYKSWLVSFPTRTPWKKLDGPTGNQLNKVVLGVGEMTPINRCMYEQVHTLTFEPVAHIYSTPEGSMPKRPIDCSANLTQPSSIMSALIDPCVIVCRRVCHPFFLFL